jgi:hypothetical protein
LLFESRLTSSRLPRTDKPSQRTLPTFLRKLANHITNISNPSFHPKAGHLLCLAIFAKSSRYDCRDTNLSNDSKTNWYVNIIPTRAISHPTVITATNLSLDHGHVRILHGVIYGDHFIKSGSVRISHSGQSEHVQSMREDK